MDSDPKRPLEIGIIGAGFAGLRCADILLQELRSNVHVTILEARDRIGGRVAQSNHLGHLVDL
jgi:monoamine oxidase